MYVSVFVCVIWDYTDVLYVVIHQVDDEATFGLGVLQSI